MRLHVCPAVPALNHWQNFRPEWGRDGERGDHELWKLPIVKPGYLKLHVTQLVRNLPTSVRERARAHICDVVFWRCERGGFGDRPRWRFLSSLLWLC